MFILSSLVCNAAPPSSHAYEKIINFETGDTSQIPEPRQNISIVPSTLPGGGNYALRCGLPQGVSQTYCGFNVAVHDVPRVVPQISDIYIRYYVKFEPSWRFAMDDHHFKSQIIELDVDDYNSGGRSFVNFNSINDTSASVVFLSYSSGTGWLDTGRTIRNDGIWHCIETRHLRNLTNPQQGRFQFWFDGQLVLNISPINMGNATPSHITFGYRNGTTQQTMYMQYDEVVVADHYVGPIGAAANLPPAPPANLRLTNN